MDLYQLKTFYTLGKVCSFTETAKILYVSQSAISHAIKKLEQTTGTKLVERKAKKISLTDAGKELFRSCETIFAEVERAQENLETYKNTFTGKIFIGSPVEFGTTILIKHMKNFIEQNKNLKLDFYFSHSLFKPLQSGELDFIIDCKEHFLPNLEKIFLFQEHYAVIASPDFIKVNNITSLSDLERVPVLSCDKELQWWNNFLISLNTSHRPEFRHIIQINHVRGLINGAIQGIGVSFVPKYTVINELADNTLQELFPEIKPMADQFCIYIKKDNLVKDKNKLLIDYLTTIRPAEFSGSGF